MRTTFIISFIVMFGIEGCTKCNQPALSSQATDCNRLKTLWERMGKEKPQLIIPEINEEFKHKSREEMTWDEFGEIVFFTAGCCYCMPLPDANEWLKCYRFESILPYLETEKIQKIKFYENMGYEVIPEKDWPQRLMEITDSERINDIINLVKIALKHANDKFAYEEEVVRGNEQIAIITNKHKFIIPVIEYEGAIRGIGWTSYELKDKLAQWGFHR
jgi:hypothetical protein